MYFPSLGKHKKRSTGTGDPKKAERFVARWKAEIDGGTWLPEADRLRFEELIALLQHDYAVNRRRSRDRMEDAVSHLRPFFEGAKASAITTDRITKCTRQRLEVERAKPATVNRELAALKRAFSLAIQARKIPLKPHIPMLREDNARKGFWAEADFRHFLTYLPDWLQPVAETAYYTGWRVADELLTRQWKHVDFTGGWLRLEPNETKNSEGRMFPLFPALRAILEQQRDRTHAVERQQGRIISPLFHRRGAPIKSYRRAWLAACVAAGFAEVVSEQPRKVRLLKIPHDFRRTAVRNLERAGVPRSAAMKMVGHKTASIYNRYAIAEEGMLREAGEKLERLQQTVAATLGPRSAPSVLSRSEARQVSP